MDIHSNTGGIRYAIPKIFGILLLELIIMIIVMQAAQMFGVNPTDGNGLMIASSLAYAIASAVMLFIAWRSTFTFREIGFRRPVNIGKGMIVTLTFTHMIYILILWFFTGVKDEVTTIYILLSLLLSALVGVGEELLFRGLIFRYLLKYGVNKAILISSILFGLVHFASTITGINSLSATLLQISNAFFFGCATAFLITLTKSLWLGIVWHFLIDVFSLIFNFSFLTTGGWMFMISMVVFNVSFALWMRRKIEYLDNKQ